MGHTSACGPPLAPMGTTNAVGQTVLEDALPSTGDADSGWGRAGSRRQEGRKDRWVSPERVQRKLGQAGGGIQESFLRAASGRGSPSGGYSRQELWER